MYDHFNVSRLATFEEIKEGKDRYLQALKDLKNTTYEGDKKLLANYTLTKDQLKDGFNILSNHKLREVYDKNNIWYSEEDFNKKKGKNIPVTDKYMNAVRGTTGFFPYLGISYMSLGADQPVGRQLVILGLCSAVFIVWQTLQPGISTTQDNDYVQFINNNIDHKYVVTLLGPKTMYWTTHQFLNWIRNVVWQFYFQMSMAISRLIDKTADQKVDQSILKIGNKQTKTMHVWEILKPMRTKEE